MQINVNDPKSLPSEASTTQSFVAKKDDNVLSVFNVFNKSEKEVIDKNNDGKISIEEVKSYLNNENSDSKVLGKIANILGVEIKSKDNFTDNIQFKKDANMILDALEKVDNNKDNNVTLQEIKNAQNLSKDEQAQVNKMFGLVDSKIENKQGRFGSCWALSAAYGLSSKDQARFADVVKQDDEGNAVVTFYGVDGEPFTTKIDRKIIQSLIRVRTKLVNQNTLNALNNQKYFSSDPDAIAIEMAFKKYEEHINDLKNKQNEYILNYINNSTPSQIQKPDIQKLSIGMTDAELKEFINYYKNSYSEDKNRYVFPNNVKSITPEIVEKMKAYIQNSTPMTVEKPTESEISYNLPKVINYMNNSHSETVPKKEIKMYKNNVGNIVSGGWPGAAVKLMAGGTLDTYWGTNFNSDTNKYEPISNEEQEKIKDILKNTKESNQVFSIAFRKADGDVYSDHAYNIVGNDDKNIYLVNPHDTNAEPVKYPIKTAVENLKILEVNSLS